MTRYILVYNHPDRGERRFELAKNRSYRIGSKPDNDIVLKQNDISRHHAVLRVRDGTFHITDLDSKNGTYVNGQRTAASSFQCGDLVNLSSARMVVVEVGSGAYRMVPEGELGKRSSDSGSHREETLGYSGEASTEDIVSLLVTVSGAIRRGAVAEPLTWAVERFGLEAAVVLYRDPDDNVAMVSSAGDLGTLVRSSSTLVRLARDQKGHRAGTRIQQISELGETLLVAPMQRDHVLVVRFTGQPPAIGDLRAVIAAVEAVLCCGNPPCLSVGTAAERRDPEVRRFGSPLQRVAGLSDGVSDCKRRAAEFARRDDPVLITGERGTGKSLFARVIHDLSPRHEQPFVVVDAEQREPVDIRSVLLGEGDGLAKGSALEEAEGGTLYLRGLTSLPLELQAELVEMIGTKPDDRPNTRVVVASSVSVDQAVADGLVRQDLLSALRVLWLHVPPLRNRCEDIPLLVTAFQREAAGPGAPGIGGFTVDALESLASYHWPDNVRELRQEVLRLMTGATEGTLVEASDLGIKITEGLASEAVPDPDLAALARRKLADGREEFERWRIRRALYEHRGNQSQAARELGLSRAGLFKKMRRLALAEKTASNDDG